MDSLGDFDLDDMDPDEREELEALLFAQVHHAPASLNSAPQAALKGPAGESSPLPDVINQAMTALLSENKAASRCREHPAVVAVNGTVKTLPVVKETVRMCCPETEVVVRNIRVESGWSGRAEGSLGCSGDPAGAAEPTPAGGGRERPPPVGHAAATSEPTPAGGGRERHPPVGHHPSGTCHSPLSVTPESSESIADGSASGPPVDPSACGPTSSNVDACLLSCASRSVVRPAPATLGDRRPRVAPPDRGTPAGAKRRLPDWDVSSSDDGEPQTKTAALAAVGRRRRARPPPGSSPEVIAVSSDSSDAVTAVVPAGRPAAAEAARSASASPEVVELPATPPPVRLAPHADLAVERRPRRAAPTPARPGRVRTSSDLSSSDGDSGATLVDVEVNIRVNVSGAGGFSQPASDVTEVVDCDSTEEGDGASLPQPAYRQLMIRDRWSPPERRLLQQLSCTPPCHKWSDQQRAAYATPRNYHLGDMDSVPDAAWQIPDRYLMDQPTSRAVRSRYYTNTQQLKRCNRCDEVGHLAAACPLPPVCHLCGLSGHSGRLRCRNVFCYACGAADHREQRCPQVTKPAFCALCKAKAHVSATCPDRWRRYHATTCASTAPVAPPSGLDARRRTRVNCWMCGRRGHPGHQCRGERYTGMASLSQHVISYTATTCASCSVAGLVATPAQMDAVFTRRRRVRIESASGAALTYEQLTQNSWLINVTGSLAAACKARELVEGVLQGRGGGRPAARSAPASPAPRSVCGGALSAPASPQSPPSPVPDRQRRPEEADWAGDRAADDDDDDVEVVEVERRPPPPPVVELVTIVSDDEAPTSPADRSARVWRLRLPAGDTDKTASVRLSIAGKLKMLRKRMLASLRRRPSGEPPRGVAGVGTVSAGEDVAHASTHTSGHVMFLENGTTVTVGKKVKPAKKTKPAEKTKNTKKAKTEKTEKTTKKKKKNKIKSGGLEQQTVLHGTPNGTTTPPTSVKKCKVAKKKRPKQETPANANSAQSTSGGNANTTRCQTSEKLELLLAAQTTPSPATRKLKRLLKRQKRRAVVLTAAGPSPSSHGWHNWPDYGET